MKTLWYIILSAVFTVAVWAFWSVLYPETLLFQEQNQLFLFTGNYLTSHIAVAGGLSSYIAEFFTQFNHLPIAGGFALAILFLAFQLSVWKASGKKTSGAWYPLSFIPSLLFLVSMGDIYVMPAHLVALTITMLAYCIGDGKKMYVDFIMVVLLYWIAGPAVWVYVALSAASILETRKNWKRSVSLAAFTTIVICLARYTMMKQYPFKMSIFGEGYYRMPLIVPALQLITAASTVIIPLVISHLPKPAHQKTVFSLQTAALTLFTAFGCICTFDRDTHQVLAFDQLVREERWEELISRAQRYQPKTDIACVDVNLALFMCGRMNEMNQFFQAGTEGLIMPRVRDFISNTGSYEVFWRLGMINCCLRYAFDSQESEMNNQKSGRHMSRIAECHIVNGNYKVAEKYLDILSHSLFYRKWASEHRKFIGRDDIVESDPVYRYLREARYNSDFLYNYEEMDKMLAILYRNNQNNIMAATYFQAWRALSEQ